MQTFKLIATLAIVPCLFTHCTEVRTSEQIVEVPFTQVQFDDSFWAPRIETNRTVSIPSAFKECEKSGRFDNFALAGGLQEGEHQGDFSFDDTDPYKIIEGASYSLAATYDPALDHYLDSIIGLIAAAQEEDGYLCTCVTNKCERLSGWWGKSRWERLNSHELYNCGHLYEAAVAHYKATGKRTLLEVALKNADLVCEVFGEEEGKIHRPGGHPIVEMALCKLYLVSGEKKYLDQAKYFVEETGRCTDGHRPSMYSQDHEPILVQQEIVGHAVRAGYLYSGVADVASLTEDEAYFEALSRIWENMASKKLYITGGIGSRAQGEGFGPNYELHNHTAYCETCASIANVYWNHRMFLATGESKYADVVERALYNGVVVGVSLSGDHFFYDNPLASMGQHQRERWFGCACCPGNITRFMASVPLYAYATQGNSVYVNLYVQGSATINTPAGELKIVQKTQYPWEGNIALEIDPQTVTKAQSIRLRIPGWAQERPVPSNLYHYTDKASSYSLLVNGKPASYKVEGGYAVIHRTWKRGDLIELELPMNIRSIAAHEEVEDNRGKMALERGPIVYCLEGKDQADGKVFDKYITTLADATATHEASLLNGVTVLTLTGHKAVSAEASETTTLRAIPYSTWCNRGSDQMSVWIATDAAHARVEPQATIASGAKSVILRAAIQNDAPETAAIQEYSYGTNDQWEPTRSSDSSKPYHYWWLKSGVEVSLSYQFETPTTVQQCEVYWLAFDHYDVVYRAPKEWKLYYLKNSRWEEVPNASGYGTELDQYNVVNFDAVTTTHLKIVAMLQDRASGGIIEWKVN